MEVAHPAERISYSSANPTYVSQKVERPSITYSTSRKIVIDGGASIDPISVYSSSNFAFQPRASSVSRSTNPRIKQNTRILNKSSRGFGLMTKKYPIGKAKKMVSSSSTRTMEVKTKSQNKMTPSFDRRKKYSKTTNKFYKNSSQPKALRRKKKKQLSRLEEDINEQLREMEVERIKSPRIKPKKTSMTFRKEQRAKKKKPVRPGRSTSKKGYSKYHIRERARNNPKLFSTEQEQETTQVNLEDLKQFTTTTKKQKQMTTSKKKRRLKKERIAPSDLAVMMSTSGLREGRSPISGLDQSSFYNMRRDTSPTSNNNAVPMQPTFSTPREVEIFQKTYLNSMNTQIQEIHGRIDDIMTNLQVNNPIFSYATSDQKDPQFKHSKALYQAKSVKKSKVSIQYYF